MIYATSTADSRRKPFPCAIPLDEPQLGPAERLYFCLPPDVDLWSLVNEGEAWGDSIILRIVNGERVVERYDGWRE